MHRDENMDKLFSRKAKLLWTFALLSAWALIFFLLFRSNGELTVENILSYQPDSPALAILIMLGLFLLKSVDFIMYSPVLYAASGILFPLPFAILLNTAGVAIMVSTPYFIGRSLGPPVLGRLYEKYPKLQIIDRLHLNDDAMASFLLRMIGLPLIPVSVYLGAVEFHYGKYLFGSILGLLPVTLCATVLGTAADDPASPAFRIALIVQVFCVALSALIYTMLSKKMNRKTERS